MRNLPTFPPDFVWGAATAAYQIEGAVDEDGRGPSIWDRFSHTPGNVANGDTGDIACDHYHRWQDDIAIMRELGLDAYRFSIAWPRILPNGRGQVNEAGLAFYERLVDALLEAGITPWPTLYHWDLPVSLQDAGGWPNRDTAPAFTHFAEVVTRRLGDRVSHWMTINEPWVIAYLGHAVGMHAPGVRDWRACLAAAHHLLLAHGQATPAIRAHAPNARIGIVLNPTTIYPASDRPEDQAAAVRADGFHNRWWYDPLAGRGYPADLVERFSPMMPAIEPQDLETIAAPTDFLGVNYYTPSYVADAPGTDALGIRQERPAGVETTATGWTVEPQGLVEVLMRLQRDYSFGPLYVTENGAAFDDPPPTDGEIADPRRVAYLHDHLQAVLEARATGADVRGYFVWSLLDNFEWAEGYSKRFGIVGVDYPTQARIIKRSGRWYQQLIASGRLPAAR